MSKKTQTATTVEPAAATAIVAGVDGSSAGTMAVQWAARAAQRHRLPLRLVNILPTMAANPYPTATLYIEQLREVAIEEGRQFLDDAAQVAKEIWPEIEVLQVLRSGDPTEVLSRESASAKLVAIGATGRSGLVELLVGSTAVELPGRSHAPVVIVRPRADGTPADSGPVVLGVAGSTLDHAPVEFAFAQASLLDTELVAVHSWSDTPLPDFDRMTGRRDDWNAIFERERRLLAQGLAGYADRYPDVKIRHVVVYDRPARALLDYASSAQLVVVGTRGRGVVTSAVLGSTSRAVVKLAQCPVAVLGRG